MQIPPYLLLDFETRSRRKLRGKTGVSGRVYAQDPSTEVLCVTFAEADAAGGWDLATLWRPRAYPFDGPLEVVVAHNAIGFDRHIWRRLGWPEPKRWLDSAVLARRAGYASSSLEELGERYGLPKDKEGNKLTVSLSQWKAGKGFTKKITPEIRERVMAYCEADVGTMIRVFEDLAIEFDFALYPRDSWQAFEERVYQTDLRILDRGIYFDETYARALLEQENLAEIEACEAAGVTPAQMRSAPQTKALLAAAGHDVANCKRATLEGIDHPLVAARFASNSITRGKIVKGLNLVTGGRLRDMTKYLGAHTWRWSGQGMQTQNLPRGAGCKVCKEPMHGCKCYAPMSIYERTMQ